MALVQSSDLLLQIDGTIVGHSKTNTFNLDADLSESTTKSSAGWQEFLQGVRNGRLTVSGLTDYTTALNFEQLASHVITRTLVTFVFKDFNADNVFYSGSGFIEEVTETARFEDITTFDVEILIHNTESVTPQPDWDIIYPDPPPTGNRKWNEIFDKWNELLTLWQNT